MTLKSDAGIVDRVAAKFVHGGFGPFVLLGQRRRGNRRHMKHAGRGLGINKNVIKCSVNHDKNYLSETDYKNTNLMTIAQYLLKCTY